MYIFNFTKPIGKGGNGTVYEAIRKQDNLKVVIKQISKRKTNIPLEDFPEITYLKKLRGTRGIIQLIDYCESPTDYIIVMETLESCTDLWNFLTTHTYLKERVAHCIFKQITIAVDSCLKKGIVHTDLKAENIIINTTNLKIKLIDFGGSKLNKQGYYTSFSGTIDFAPPEVHSHNQYTAQGIISWTMGTILYNMICGNVPFDKPDQIHQKYKNYEHDMKAEIHSIRTKDISPQCIHLIIKCLQKEERYRYNINQIWAHPWIQYGMHTNV